MLELGVGGGVKNKLNYPVEAILRVLIGGLFTWPPVPGAEEGESITWVTSPRGLTALACFDGEDWVVPPQSSF
jgi:hypothetical protein